VKGASYVLSTLAGAEAHLWQSLSLPLYCFLNDGHVEQLSQFSSQQRGLVIAPFPQPPLVQGDGQQNIAREREAMPAISQ